MPRATPRRDNASGQSGQAMLEYAVSAIVMATLVFGVVDFSRAIYQQQVITNLAAEGANLASRGTATGDSAAAVIADSDLNLSSHGKVIVSAAQNTGPNAVTVKAQSSQGSLSASSRVGTLNGTATLPAGAIPTNSQTVYVAEVFYSFQPITPIGKLIQTVLPVQLYDAAYY